MLFESGRVREKTGMGFVGNRSGNIRIPRDPAVVLIQSRDSEM